MARQGCKIRGKRKLEMVRVSCFLPCSLHQVGVMCIVGSQMVVVEIILSRTLQGEWKRMPGRLLPGQMRSRWGRCGLGITL